MKRLHGWQSAPGTFRSTNDGQEFILQLYLAHAHYVQGVAEKDERGLGLAKQYLEKVGTTAVPVLARTPQPCLHPSLLSFLVLVRPSTCGRGTTRCSSTSAW